MRAASRTAAIALLGGLLAAQAVAAPFAGAPIADARLDGLRGGFDDGRGLQASFGIERSVTINGAVVSTQSLYIADLGRVSAEQARQLGAMLSGVTVVRNGPGNVVAATTGPALAGATVIQNTLDGQAIKAATTIDASTNSLRALQGMNAAAALRDALVAPVSPRP